MRFTIGYFLPASHCVMIFSFLSFFLSFFLSRNAVSRTEAVGRQTRAYVYLRTVPLAFYVRRKRCRYSPVILVTVMDRHNTAAITSGLPRPFVGRSASGLTR